LARSASRREEEDRMTHSTHPEHAHAIPTRYRGTLFRSKLEADWARGFDALRLGWRYEHEARYFGDTFYLPDFWLPRSRQFVEVKGVWTPEDCRKVHALIHHVPARKHTDAATPDIAIVACEPSGIFRGWQRRHGQASSWSDFLIHDSRIVELFACARCGGWWFGDPEMALSCQCCGAYDGAKHIRARLDSPLPGFPDVSLVAFHARYGF
jgi:hypothetical protein